MTPKALVLLAALPLAAIADGPYAVYETETPFDDVMDALKMGIQERGMYINNMMHMGEMLERTGQDLGFDEQIYLKAESIEFCSAVLSRKMTAEDPTRIVNCPFIISAYVLPSTPETTYIVHREISSAEVAASAVMGEVAAMLKGVADTALAW